MDSPKKYRLAQLANILNSLDLDEGVRIEGPEVDKTIFISKSASGIFAVEIRRSKSHLNTNVYADIKYFDSTEDLVSFVKSIFRKNASLFVY
jgi:hypothetical protein